MLLLLPAFAFAGLLLGGCGGSATPTTTVQPTAVAPTFSPIGGSFTATQSVTITDATTGASIYYTTDGSTPTIASTKYSSPISVAATTTIKAIAIASGFNTSAVASGAFTINLPAAATPTFSPAGGTFTVAQSITITDATPGATIHYTVDGSTPTAGSANYSAPVAVATTTTIQAIATASGFSPSTVGSAVYTINIPTQQVSVVLSTHDQTQLLAPQAAVTFGTSAVSSNQLLIDENQQTQPPTSSNRSLSRRNSPGRSVTSLPGPVMASGCPSCGIRWGRLTSHGPSIRLTTCRWVRRTLT
jgi:hypothetical protein